MYTTRENGTKKYVPLADLLEDPDAEVRRREPPGFDQELWRDWAHFVARLLGKVRPEEPKLLLLDGCKVHYDLDGLLALRAANLEEVTWAYGSISNSGKAVLANSEAVTKAINEKLRADADKAKAAARKAADKQQRSENRAREALI
eukprot:contig_11496_g2741